VAPAPRSRPAPFAFNPDPQAHGFRVFFAENLQTGQLGYTAAGRGLRRQLGTGAARLPRTSAVNGALAETEYDAQNWDAASPKFRNRARRVAHRQHRQPAGAAQPRARVDRRGHGARDVAERPGLLPQPLQRGPGVGGRG
jgi:hypothetical protein